MAWKKEPRRHSLARKGIKTVIDDDTRLAVNNYVARGVKYIGTGPSMHGCMDRSYDTHIFEDSEGEKIEVVVFNEPDWESISDQISFEGLNTKQTKELLDEEEKVFNETGGGEFHVIYGGALEFTGTEKEFKKQYPDIYTELF